MSFQPRAYEDTVRDLLTTLTGGTVREELPAPPSGSLVVPEKLKRRPVRRVSHLIGRIATGTAGDAPQIDYRFTSQDFDLVAASGRVGDEDTIRFREDGRRPIPGSRIIVNYYPVQADPTPLTDINVGSVTRTLVETFARELALLHQQLQQVYDRAFLDTAKNSALDRVVALVGVERIRAGHAIATIRFERQQNASGRITIPAGTAVTDGKGNRYRTLITLTMEPNETTAEATAAGETPQTPEVDAGALNRAEVLIAGISSVANPKPSHRPTVAENDDDLRRRARGALHGAVRGTLDSLRFSLLSIPGVKDVALEEEPNGVPGEVRVTFALAEDNAEVRADVARVIAAVRPAGIRVLQGEAGRLRVGVRGDLTLEGSGLSERDSTELARGVEASLAEFLSHVPPGGKIRRAQLTSLAMADPRVVDATVQLLPEGQATTDELQLGTTETLELIRPFAIATKPERAAVGPATISNVTALLTIHLGAGVTQAEAASAIALALRAHLQTRAPGAALTFDSVAAAIRDDTRYALIRAQGSLTIETADGRFVQLADGAGSYEPAQSETLQLNEPALAIQEGSV
ncbi:MAG TPA: baseplate J/gp47 family protein, partial [Longimicrobiales bacterium]